MFGKMVCSTVAVQGNPNFPRNSNPKPKNSLQRRNLTPLLQNCKNIIHIKQLHAKVIRTEQEQNPFIVFELLRLCSNLNSVHYASEVFNRVWSPNVFLYTALIDGFVSSGMYVDAIHLYFTMNASILPDNYAITSGLRACGFRMDLKSGREIHGHGIKLGLCSNRSVKLKLVELYGKCGEFRDARKMFDEMPQSDFVASTVLMSCFFDHRLVREASEVFSRVQVKDTVCWTAMIDGLVKNGEMNMALQAFRSMQVEKVIPNEATIVCVLSACSHLGALELGRWAHSYMGKYKIDLNRIVGGALINMYSKCGDIETAWNVFDEMPLRDVSSYNAIIAGLGVHGKSTEALEIFSEMIKNGFEPNSVTFVAILNACSHNGLVDLGLEIFESMARDHSLEPQIEHYGCVVDLLGRAGRLEEAYSLVKRLKTGADHIMLGSILSACKIHGNLQLAERISKTLVNCGKADSGTFVLLSNAYASSGNFEEAARARVGVKKEPGCSSIEVNNEIHEFLSGDVRHPEKVRIYEKLRDVEMRLRLVGGYFGTKKTEASLHSERLAICYGLISTEPRTSLRVVKNLRVCSDCHDVIKLIAKVYKRRIVVWDRNRFHHFENCVCSCGDYW